MRAAFIILTYETGNQLAINVNNITSFGKSSVVSLSESWVDINDNTAFVRETVVEIKQLLEDADCYVGFATDLTDPEEDV